MEETSLFDVGNMQEEIIKSTLNEVAKALEERGYDATNQIAGYLISGDPGFISSHHDARNKIISIDRSEIVKCLLKKVLEEK